MDTGMIFDYEKEVMPNDKNQDGIITELSPLANGGPSEDKKEENVVK